jgi:drug/metabolite transporter (DMT)-like permease
MLIFVALCLLARLAYAFNDVLVGAVAREYDRVEVAAMRGVSLGLTMAPLLCWVPGTAFAALAQRWPSYLLLITLTGICNVLQNHAARFLPFGLRAAITLSAVSLATLASGAVFFAERLSLPQGALCLLLVGAAVVAAFGEHATHELRPDIPRGAALALAAGTCLGLAAVMTKRLAAETHPLLTAWAWEFGAGVILLPPLLYRWRRTRPAPGLARRFWRTAVAAAPTVVGSGASMTAIGLGPLGVWGALAGTQVLFIALLGVRWHREAMGWRRWACFLVAAASVAGLALAPR